MNILIERALTVADADYIAAFIPVGKNNSIVENSGMKNNNKK